MEGLVSDLKWKIWNIDLKKQEKDWARNYSGAFVIRLTVGQANCRILCKENPKGLGSF
jgi:hypothetical protein